MSSVIKANHVHFSEKALVLESFIEELGEVHIEEEGTPSEDNIIDEIQQLRETSRLEAEKIIEDAMEEAKRMKEDAESEIQSQQKIIYQQAKIDGFEEGKRTAQEEMEARLAEIEDLKQKALLQRDQLLNEVEPHMVNLIKEILGNILGTHIKYDDQFILYLIKTGFDTDKDNKNIKIRVNDSHKNVIEENKNLLYEGLSEETKIEIIYDKDMKKGDCIFETAYGNIDLSLDEQLEKFKEYIDLLSNEK